jgi:hypothetical protein
VDRLKKFCATFCGSGLEKVVSLWCIQMGRTQRERERDTHTHTQLDSLEREREREFVGGSCAASSLWVWYVTRVFGRQNRELLLGTRVLQFLVVLVVMWK